MKDFRSLKVWQRSHELVLSVHKATLSFPKYEGLNNQAMEVKRMLTGFIQKLNTDG